MILENQPSPESADPQPQLTQNKFSFLLSKLKSTVRTPKFIGIFILLFTLLVVLLALNLISQKESESVATAPSQSAIPSPSSSPDPTREDLTIRVEKYKEKLKNVGNYQNKLKYPIVDLEISFE